MLTLLLLTLAIFGLAMLALATGMMVSGRSLPGSCGGRRGEPSGGEFLSCGGPGQEFGGPRREGCTGCRKLRGDGSG